MWKDLTLEDKKLIDSWFQKYPCGLSDYTFTNLWIWNAERNYQFQIIEGCLCIRFQNHGVETYLMPIGDRFSKALMQKLLLEMPQFTMRAISEEKQTQIKDLLPASFSIKPEETRFDYLYSFDELKSLKGNALQPKRNLIHQFEDHYDYEFQTIDINLLPSVIEMHNKLPQTDITRAELRALQDFEKLGIQGGTLSIDKEIIAYTLAEKLTPDTLVIHIEKALKEFKGAYQTINQLFLTHTQPVLYVNREEDLGIPELEQAKHSYHPIKLVKKFIISL